MNTLKVSSKSKVRSVAGAIAEVVRKDGKAEIKVIGAGAVNQAIKAVAVARGFMAPSGIELICIPAFENVIFDTNEDRTMISIIVKPNEAV